MMETTALGTSATKAPKDRRWSITTRSRDAVYGYSFLIIATIAGRVKNQQQHEAAADNAQPIAESLGGVDEFFVAKQPAGDRRNDQERIAINSVT